MSLVTTQACERCGKSREMASRTDHPDIGGWRTLNSGSLEATFCNFCVRDLVTTALASAAARKEATPR